MFRKMLKKCYLLVAILLMAGGIFCLLPSRLEDSLNFSNQSSAATISKGEKYGQSDVYIIHAGSTGAEELGEIAKSIGANESTYTSATFYLEGDIDLDGQFWAPIGTKENPFKGVFYGNGHKISNLLITEELSIDKSYLGLFGYIDGATIADLRIGGNNVFNVKTTPTSYGTMVGYAASSAIINCYEESVNKKLTVGDPDSSTDFTPVNMYSIGGGTSSIIYEGACYLGKFDENNENDKLAEIVDPESGTATKATNVTRDTEKTGISTGYVSTFTVDQPTWSATEDSYKGHSTTTLISGYYGFYKVVNGKAEEFYNPFKGDKTTGGTDVTTKGIRVLLKISEGKMVIDTSSPSKAGIFLKDNFIQRSEVNETNKADNEGKVFALKEGVKLTMPVVSSSEKAEMTEEASPILVNFDAKHGGETVNHKTIGKARTASTEQLVGETKSNTYPYDMSFLTYFSLYTGYVRRLGYDFAGIHKKGSSSNLDFNITVEETTKNEKLTTNADVPTDFLNQFPYACTGDVATGDKYEMGWTRNNDPRNFNIKLVMASDEGSNFSSNFDIVEDAIDLSVQDLPETPDKKENALALSSSKGRFKEYTISSDSVLTDDTFKFSITLQSGYRITLPTLIKVGDGEDAQYFPQPIENDTEFLLNGDVASKTSGIYPNFTGSSGEKEKYKKGTNYDVYSPTYIYGEWVNEKTTYKMVENVKTVDKPGFDTNSNIDKTYNFTIGNIVGAGGTVYLVVERDWLKVDVTPEQNTAVVGDDGNLKYTWSLLQSKAATAGSITEDGTNFFFYSYDGGFTPVPQDLQVSEDDKETEEDDDKFVRNISLSQPASGRIYLYLRRGEKPVVKLAMEEKYILGISNQTMSTSPQDDGARFTSTGSPNILKQTKAGVTSSAVGYFQVWIFNIEFSDVANGDYDKALNDNHKLTIVCGSLLTRVTANFYEIKNVTNEGETKIVTTLIENETDLAGLAVFVNPSNLETDQLPSTADDGLGSGNAKTVGLSDASEGTATDSIYVAKNTKFQAAYFKLKDEKTGSTSGEYNLTDDESYYTYWTGSKILVNATLNGDSSLNYTIDVYFKQRTYDVTIQYKIEDGVNEVEIKNNLNYLFDTAPTNYTDQAVGKFSDPISFTLGEIGRGVLSFKSASVSGSTDLSGPSLTSTIQQSGTSTEGGPGTVAGTSASDVDETPGKYDFDFTLGYYDTTITFTFVYKSVDFKISKLYYDGDTIDGAMTAIEKIFKFNFNDGAEGPSLSLVETSGVNGDKGSKISSISISSQYYLLKWYIKGTASVAVSGTGLDVFMSDQTALEAIAKEVGGTNALEVEFGGLMPYVGLRTVTVYYSVNPVSENDVLCADTAGNLLDGKDRKQKVGEISWNIKEGKANVLSDLSDEVFFNVGYILKGYSALAGTITWDETGKTYTLEIKDFARLFAGGAGAEFLGDEGTGLTAWSAFAVGATAEECSTDLAAIWEAITYKLQIDSQNDQQITVKLGSSISYSLPATTSSDYKLGFANYTIQYGEAGKEGSTTSKATGDKDEGYVVTGYKLYQSGDETNGKVVNSGEEYTITAQILYDILTNNSTYRFQENDATHPIIIKTLREPATYYLILAASPYYHYNWNDDSGIGEKITDESNSALNGAIRIKVKYKSLPTDLNALMQENATDSTAKKLEVVRDGYTCNGWVLANDDGTQQLNQALYTFKTEFDHQDVMIVPTWARDISKETVTSLISYEPSSEQDEAKKEVTYYMGYNKQVATGTIGGDNLGAGSNEPGDRGRSGTLLLNGEYIKSYKFDISFVSDDKTPITKQYSTTSKDGLTLADLSEGSGKYTVKFTIEVGEVLNLTPRVLETYTVSSEEITITLKKNVIKFIEYSLTSVYTGTSTFVVPDERYTKQNNFGSFLFEYSWDGKANAEAIGSVVGEVNYFVNPTIIGSGDDGSDYNVSVVNKTLRWKLNTDQIGALQNQEGSLYYFGANPNYSLIFENVFKGKNGVSGYFVNIENAVELQKAKFTISFPNGTGYAIPDVETLICDDFEPGRISYTGYDSEKIEFTYTLGKLTLKAAKSDGTLIASGQWRGNENHDLDSATFNVYDLIITGHESELDTNFEWNISTSSLFEFLDTSKALKFEYTVGYVVAREGKLQNAEKYKDQINKISIDTIKVNDVEYEIVDPNQGTVYFENREQLGTSRRAYLIYYYDNVNNKLIIYIDTDLLNGTGSITKVGLSYNLNLSNENSDALVLLGNAPVDSSADIENLVETSNNSGYTFTISPLAEYDKVNYKMLLSDAVKVSLDFNKGWEVKEGENRSKAEFYVSVDGPYTISVPQYGYDGITFKTFDLQANSRIKFDSSSESGGYVFTSTKGGPAENVTARWSFNSIVVTPKGSPIPIEKYASKTAITIDLTEMVDFSLPAQGLITSQSYQLQRDGQTFDATSSFTGGILGSGLITFSLFERNNKNFATTDLTGDYKLIITIKFHDGEEQSQTVNFDVHITIKINQIDVNITDDTKRLEYNNTGNRQEDIKLAFMLNGGADKEKDSLLSALKTTDNQSSIYNVYWTCAKSLKDVDNYTIKFIIESQYQKIFQFTTGEFEKEVSFEIYQFTIKLGEEQYYVQINFSKSFGENDPLFEKEIEVFTKTKDKVTLRFSRADTSDEIGEYALEFIAITSDNSDNYRVDTTGFDATSNSKFKINKPSGGLKIEILDHNLNYIYNGKTLSTISATYLGEDLYKLSGVIDGTDQEVETTFKLYFGNKISIPDNVRASYAEHLKFTVTPKKVVGKYEISVEITGTVHGQDQSLAETWGGVSFVNSDGVTDKTKAYVEVTKRDLYITGITKVFDGNNNISYNTASEDECNCTITFRTGDNEGLVTIEGVVDKVIISGRIPGENTHRVGTYSLDSKSVGTSGIYINAGADDLGGCYTLKIDSAEAKVTPSSKKVTISGEQELDYGSIVDSGDGTGIYTSQEALEKLLSVLKLNYSSEGFGTDGKINKESFTVTKVVISDAAYSTGHYLKVKEENEGKYSITITVISPDFFLDGENAEEQYESSQTIEVLINKVKLTISNSPNNNISKDYDGNVSLPEIEREFGEDASPFIASGLLKGDRLYVNEGHFVSPLIGEQEIEITLDVNDDHANYDITYNDLHGTIRAIILYFNKDVHEDEFVKDNENVVGKEGQIVVEFKDNSVPNLIDNILKTVLTRKGYTHEGYSYNGNSIADIKNNGDLSAAFLQAAVDAGKEGLDLYVVWSRNELIVTIETYDTNTKERSHTEISWTGSTSRDPENPITEKGDNKITITALYFDSFDDIKLNVGSGYKIKNIPTEYMKKIEGVFDKEGEGTRIGRFSLSNVQGTHNNETGKEEFTVKIEIVEFEIKVVLNENNTDSKFELQAIEGAWKDKTRTLTYSQWTEAANDLPETLYSKGYLWAFAGWELKGVASVGDNVWARINGDELTTDTEIFTFDATWELGEFKLKITTSHTTDIKVVVDDTTLERQTAAEGDYYIIHFTESPVISIKGEEFYRNNYTKACVTGKNNGVSDTMGRDGNYDVITVTSIEGDITVNIDYVEAQITIKTKANARDGSVLVSPINGSEKESSVIKAIYQIGLGTMNLNDFFTSQSSIKTDRYLCTTGTYTQIGWKYVNADGIEQEKLYDINTDVIDIKELIRELLGTSGEYHPNKDDSITLNAVFQGDMYEVTFVIGQELIDAYNCAFVEGGGTSTTKSIRYGDILKDTDIPVFAPANFEFIWAIQDDSSIETFAANKPFISTSFISADHVMTLTAKKGIANYQIKFEINNHSADQEVKVFLADGTDITNSAVPVMNGETITFTFTLPVGYTINQDTINAQGFKFEVDNSRNIQAHEETFKIIKADAESEQPEITIYIEVIAKEYKIKFKVTPDYETVNKKGNADPIEETTIHYDELGNDVFGDSNITYTRGGYRIGKLVTAKGELFATYISETEIDYSGSKFFTNKNERWVYTNDAAEDVEVYIVWHLDDADYINVIPTPVNGHYYNEGEQVIATSRLEIDGSTAAFNEILKNGETITDVYYVIEDGRPISVKEVADFALNYINAIKKSITVNITIQDSSYLRDDHGSVRTVTVTFDVELKPAVIIVKGANIVGYYTGSSYYWPVAENNYGELYYYDADLASETWHKVTYINKIDKVEFVDEREVDLMEKYCVGTNYKLKYFFTTLPDFKLSNYNGFVDNKDGKYTYTTDEMLEEGDNNYKVFGTIQEAQIVLTFQESGYFNGLTQRVQDPQMEILGGSDEFSVTNLVVTTKSTGLDTYNQTTQFTFGWTLTRTVAGMEAIEASEEFKSKNFKFVFSPDTYYSIITTDNAYKVTFGVQYFDVEELALQDVTTGDYIKIDSFQYDANDVEDAGKYSKFGETFNYFDKGVLIMTVTGNGQGEFYVWITKGKSVTFNLSAVKVELQVLKWNWKNEYSDTPEQLRSLLEKLNAESLSKSTMDLTVEPAVAERNYVAVLTDYIAVRLRYKDSDKEATEESNEKYVYIRTNNEISIPNALEWVGFDFKGWDVEGSGLELRTDTIYCPFEHDLKAVNIYAKYEISEPDVEGIGDEKWVFQAHLAKSGDDSFENIKFSSIWKDGKIKNRNDDSISYYFNIYKGEELITVLGDESFNLPANTTSNGKYRMNIRLERSGAIVYKQVEKDVYFTIEVTKLTMVAPEAKNLVTDSTDLVFTYKNEAFDDKIEFEFNCLGIENTTFDKLHNLETSSYYFKLGGKSETEIKLAGEYTLMLVLDETIFDNEKLDGGDYCFAYTVNVNKAILPINEEDIIALNVADKFYGAADPVFENLSKQINNEEVYFSLTREKGESRGLYPFHGESLNDNYNIQLSEGLSFEIKELDATLIIRTKDNKKLNKTYDKETTEFILEYSNRIWTIKLGFVSAELELAYKTDDSDEEHELTIGTDMYAHALEKIHAFDSYDVLYVYGPSYDADEYSGPESILYDGEGAFKDYQFIIDYEITQRELQIKSITKEFDRSPIIDIGIGSVEYLNRVEGDDVYIYGQFSTAHAGTGIPVVMEGENRLELRGETAKNYKLASSYSGTITQHAIIGEVSLTLKYTSYEYATIYEEMDLNVIKLDEMFSGIELFIEGIGSDLVNGFVTLEGIAIDEENLSVGAGYLKVGKEMPIRVIFATNDLIGLSANGYEVKIEITPRELDLKDEITIIKKYDGTKVVKNIDKTINSSLLPSKGNGKFDDVFIDVEKCEYDNYELGTWDVNIVLGGEDAANYLPLKVKGSIVKHKINVYVNQIEENETLVPGGKFVDGIKMPERELKFELSYPLSEEFDLNDIAFPRRDGYRAVKWMYQDEMGTFKPFADDIDTVLDRVALASGEGDGELTLYIQWEIIKYELKISVDDVPDYRNYTVTSTTGKGVEGDSENGYKLEYYTSVEIAFEADKGYVINTIAATKLNAVDKNIEANFNTRCNATLTNITGENALRLTFTPIKVEFVLDPNIPVLGDYPNNIKEKLVRKDHEATTFKVDYQALADTILPQLQVTDGTYVLSGYNYIFDGEYPLDMGLDKLIEKCYPDISSDVTIELKAQWKGVRYQIKFDPTEGDFNGKPDTIEAYFGESLPTLPIPERAGMEVIRWNCADGMSYNTDNLLVSIGNPAISEGQSTPEYYTLILTAEWEYIPHQITINFDDNIKIYLNGELLEQGKPYVHTLKYNDALRLIIEPEAGYSFKYTKNSDFVVDVMNNDVEITKVAEDCEITFNVTPKPYELYFYHDGRVSNYEIYIYQADGDNLLETEEKLIRKVENSPHEQVFTGQFVVVKFTGSRGYVFDNKDKNIDFTGGNRKLMLETQLEGADGKVLKCIVSNFGQITADQASLTVRTVPGNVHITYKGLSQLDTLNFNSKRQDLSNKEVGEFDIEAGSTLEISGTLSFGYTEFNFTTSDNEIIIVTIENNYNADHNVFVFYAKLQNYFEDFTIEFKSKPRIFEFSLSSQSPSLGKVSEGIERQQVEYGGTLKLGQEELDRAYEFAGWFIGDTRICEISNCELVLGVDLRSTQLSNEDENGIINIEVRYQVKIVDEQFSVVGRGSITITRENDSDSLDVLSGEQTIWKIVQGQNIYIQLNPNEGYILDTLLIDGTLKTPSDYGYDETNKRLQIFIDWYNPVESIQISFKAGQATIIVQAVTSISNTRIPGTTAGGKIFITDENGNKLPEDVYKPYNNDLIIGGNYSIDSYTDVILYFIIEAKEGFTPNIITTQGVTVSGLVKNGILVYTVFGLKNNSIIQAVFTAKENTVNIHFEVEGQKEQAVAGRVLVDTSSNLIKSNPRNGYYADVGIITGENLVFNLYLYPSFVFDTEDSVVKYHIIYGGSDEFAEGSIKVSDVKPCSIETTGFSSMITFTVENVTTDAEIIFYVLPKEFSIKFKVLDDSPEIVMSKKIIYGQQWSLNNLPADEKGRILATRPNFSFVGYFTKPLGNGTLVIDRYGEVQDIWRFSGYSSNGAGVYVADDNYDPNHDTFTLYAAWTYDTADIQIQFVPQSIVVDRTNYSIESVITNLREADAWIGQESKWAARIAVGSRLNISAINFEGYVFDKFTLQFGNSEGVVKPANFTLELEMGVYILTAYYRPTITIKIVNTNNDLADGGTGYARQNGNNVENSYDPEALLSIVAKANEGYNFIKWQILRNGIYVDLDGKGELNASGEYVYNFQSVMNESITLIAYFEGKTIALKFDDSEIQGYHQIVSKKLNGVELLTNEITAYVGDVFTVVINKIPGYNINIENTGLTVLSISQDGSFALYTLECKLTYDVLEKVDENSYKKVIKIGLLKEELTFNFTYTVLDPVDDAENSRGGFVNIVNVNNNLIQIDNNGLYKNKYGENFAINVVRNSNYRLVNINLRRMIEGIGMQGYDITAYMDENNQIIFNKSLMDRFFAYQIYIDITFQRLQWDDEEIIGSLYSIVEDEDESYVVADLTGSGTEEDPYIISSATEFALMSYLVNNGYVNYVGEKYSEAYYMVINNIDFEGRFWIPIGSEENPFEGFIDLGKCDFYNIEHIKIYTNPPTSHSGLFWHIGKEGNVKEDNSILIIVLLSISIPIFILIIILIIILILRKKKKDELDDISNQ